MNQAEDTNASGTVFDALLDAAVDGIVVINVKGVIRRFSRAAEQIFGYSQNEVCGRNVSRLMPQPYSAQHDDYIAQYLSTGQASIIGVGREVTGLKKNGETFPMFLSVGEIKKEGEERFVGIIRDLSEVQASREQVRQLEDQLMHADRLVILGELTAGIAHEINQPLTAIAAYADAGKKMVERNQGAPGADINTICNRIGEQSRRAASVVRKLRKLVRSGTVSKASHNINQIIRNTLLLFEFEIKKEDIELSFVPAKSLEPLYVDEIHIQQIMVNLVKNGIDAISQSGTESGRIDIRIERDEEEVFVSVTDNGPGVPEEHQNQLFEAFFTTKPSGVGLGLSICKTIAAAHGGTLRYSKPEQGGSRFTLSLPLEFIG